MLPATGTDGAQTTLGTPHLNCQRPCDNTINRKYVSMMSATVIGRRTKNSYVAAEAPTSVYIISEFILNEIDESDL
jgi:hypothetical protein